MQLPRAGLSLLLLLLSSNLARAQEADSEFPEGATVDVAERDLTRPRTFAEEQRWLASQYDPIEPEHCALVQAFVGVGGALESSLDRALVAHDYANSPLVTSADLAFLWRAESWVQLGARVGGRGRLWANALSPTALGGGVDALALAHFRVHLGKTVDVGAAVGAGVGWATLTLEQRVTHAAVPRVFGGLVIGFRLASGVRLMVRGSWDWFTAYDLAPGGLGLDLDLGGPAFGAGMEFRR